CAPAGSRCPGGAGGSSEAKAREGPAGSVLQPQPACPPGERRGCMALLRLAGRASRRHELVRPDGVGFVGPHGSRGGRWAVGVSVERRAVAAGRGSTGWPTEVAGLPGSRPAPRLCPSAVAGAEFTEAGGRPSGTWPDVAASAWAVAGAVQGSSAEGPV